MVHLAGVATLDDQPDLGSLLLTDQVVVHRTGEQQRRDRRIHLVTVAIAEHDDARAVGDCLADLDTQRIDRPLERKTATGHAVETADRDRRQLGERQRLAVGDLVDLHNLGELVVVDDRERQHQLAAALRTGLQQVPLRADRGPDRRDDLFADRVERRVGDLREQLLEVVEQHPRPLAEHGDRRVGTHRTQRFAAALGHRRHDQLQLFVGVTEHLLAAQHGGMAVLDVFALGELGQVHETIVEPLLVRLRLRKITLDLIVFDDATLLGVDQEHLPRLEAALADHLRRVELDDAGLAGQHHDVVAGHPIPAGTQAIAVEHGADHGAIGECHAGRAIPRLHQRRVEAIERALVGIHRVVVLPRLGDHHQHCVRQAAPAEVKQFEHLVEARRVAATGRADRERSLETGHQITGQQRLARAHPVAIALHRIDLAVVGDEAVRVRERPRREGVRAEPAVHQCERRLEALITEVGEEHAELRRGEHALVDQGAAAQRREVGTLLGGQFVFDALAGDEQLAVEIDSGSTGGIGHEQLPERRHDLSGAEAQTRRVDRHVAPTQHGQAFVGHDGVDARLRLLGSGGVGWEERQPDRIRAVGREIERDDRAQEPIRDLDQDARTVTGVGLGAGGAAMLHVAQRADTHRHDGTRTATLHVGDEADATGVVFEPGVVQTGGRGKVRVE